MHKSFTRPRVVHNFQLATFTEDAQKMVLAMVFYADGHSMFDGDVFLYRRQSPDGTPLGSR